MRPGAQSYQLGAEDNRGAISRARRTPTQQPPKTLGPAAPAATDRRAALELGHPTGTLRGSPSRAPFQARWAHCTPRPGDGEAAGGGCIPGMLQGPLPAAAAAPLSAAQAACDEVTAPASALSASSDTSSSMAARARKNGRTRREDAGIPGPRAAAPAEQQPTGGRRAEGGSRAGRRAGLEGPASSRTASPANQDSLTASKGRVPAGPRWS